MGHHTTPHVQPSPKSAILLLLVLSISVNIVLIFSNSRNNARDVSFAYDTKNGQSGGVGFLANLLHNDDHNSMKVDTIQQFPSPTFIFLMGIEGTGHHYFNSLLNHSSYVETLQELGLCEGGVLERISDGIFFSLKSPGGLFNPMSNAGEEVAPNGRKRRDFNSAQYFDELVRSLEEVSQTVIQSQSQDPQSPSSISQFHIPLNANSCSALMSSYPTLRSRPHQNDPRFFPHHLASVNLDTFYDACNAARVNCRHVYLFRDPYAVLKSTSVNRSFNKKIMDAIQLYTFQLQLIYAQLGFYKGRTWGCFNFLDEHDGSKYGGSRREDWDRFGSMFGWASSQEFWDYAMESHEAGKAMTLEEKNEIVDESLAVFMKGFLDIHERVIDLCYGSLGPLS